MGDMASATTRSGVIFDALRADILGGVFEPGNRLHFATLVRRYEASIGSLREALQRLTEVGLVESTAQHGFRVLEISDEDLRDLTQARMEVEVAVLRLAIEDGGITWEGDCVAALHVLERTPRRVDASDYLSEQWTIAHAAFHRTLLSGCGNARLLAVAERLRDVAELYRHWTSWAELGDPGDAPDDEHRGILEAALRRDADGAGELMRRHILRAQGPLRPRAARSGRAAV
ncbi:FCD domain-containing protein [Microbacterium sp. NPDC091313]